VCEQLHGYVMVRDRKRGTECVYVFMKEFVKVIFLFKIPLTVITAIDYTLITNLMH